MSDKGKIWSKDLFHLGIMVLIIAFFWLNQSFGQSLTPIGMKVLGVFLAGCYGWTTAGTFWPSILCMCLLPFTGVATMAEVLAQGPGNNMFLFIMFMLVFNQLLDDAGVNVTIANWLISRRIVSGRPWLLIFVILTAGYLTATVCNVFLCLFLMWSLIYGICKGVGYRQHDKLPTILVIAMLFCIMMGYLTMPFHGMTVILLGAFAKMAGAAVAFGTYLSFSLPVGFGSVILTFLVIRFIVRPDVEKLKNYDVHSIPSEDIKFTRRKVIILGSLLFFVLSLLLSGILPAGNLYAKIITTLGNSGLIALIMMALLFVTVEGKPLYNFKETAAKGLSFDILMCTMYMLALGTFVSSEKTGINGFFMEIFSPLLGGLSPVVFCIVIGLVCVFLTNFLSNIGVAYMFLPLAVSFGPVIGFEPTALAMLIIYCAHVAMITPAASIYAAIMHSNTDWVTPKEATLYSLLIVVGVAVIIVPLGVILAFAVT